MPSQITGSNNT